MYSISDRIIATIKTGVPALYGLAIAWLLSHVPAVAAAIDFIDTHLSEITFGVPIVTVIELAAVAAVIAGYHWLASKINARFPAVGRWLLGSSLVPGYGIGSVEAHVPEVPVDVEDDVTRREYRDTLEEQK